LSEHTNDPQHDESQQAWDLRNLGWTPDRESAWNEQHGAPEHAAEGLHPARVAEEQRGGHYLLHTQAGAVHAEISGRLRYLATEATELPAVGDWVAASLRPEESAATIHEVLPRHSALVRQTPGDRAAPAQVMAANLDTVWVVTSVNPDFNPRRIERTLALVRESGALGVVVLSKCDLNADLGAIVTEAAIAAPDTPVHMVSAVDGTGLEALQPYLTRGASVALIGSSGVGKSTLANRLLGREVLAVSDIRGDDDKGRHTTTHRELVPLPGGGVLIDTPGIREIGLWSDDEGGVASAFPEIDALLGQCRFPDCGHTNEPGCAILAGLADGTLDPARLDSYYKLEREAERIARKRNARGRHEERQKHKSFAKMLKQRPDKRDRR
jgi:ribosome biogenesis GTPase